MRTLTGVTLCIGLLAVASAGFDPGAASAATFKVHCGTGPSIQDRLDRNVAGGDTVEISGTCIENVIVNVPGVRLVGEPGAQIIAADPGRPTVTVQTNRASITGLTISGGLDGIRVLRSGAAIIRLNVIVDNVIGIDVFDGSSAFIEANEIRHNGFDGNGDPINRGHGIFVGGSSNAVIVGNDIDDNGDIGVRVADASAARINDNDITNNRNDGIDVTLNSSVRLSDPAQGSTVGNRINGNGGVGWRCRFNSTIWPVNSQDFTGGNGLSNTSLETGCIKQGPLF